MSDLEIDVSSLQAMLEAGEPVTIVDVRQSQDRVEWQVPGSLHFDRYQALKARDPRAMESLALPADRPIVAL